MKLWGVLILAVLGIATIASSEILHPGGGSAPLEGLPLRMEFGGTGSSFTSFTDGRCVETYIDDNGTPGDTSDDLMKQRSASGACGTGSGGGGTECSAASCNLNVATVLNSKGICLTDGTNCMAAPTPQPSPTGMAFLANEQTFTARNTFNGSQLDLSTIVNFHASTTDANVQWDPTGTGVLTPLGPGILRANDVVCTGCVGTTDLSQTYLTTEVDGSITNELPIAGVAIDISGSPLSTVDWDSTEVTNTTWGANNAATLGHTFATNGTHDVTMNYTDANVAIAATGVPTLQLDDSDIAASGDGNADATFSNSCSAGPDCTLTISRQIAGASQVVIQGISSGRVQIGDSSNVSLTVTTDGTGTGEVVLPNDSITLGTETDGNYAGSASEGGPATSALALSTLTQQKTLVLFDTVTIPTTTDIPSIWPNRVANATITEVCCEVDSATDTTIQLQNDDGTPANILSASLTCATAIACTTGFTAEATVLAGDEVDFLLVTNTDAKRINVTIKYTIP